MKWVFAALAVFFLSATGAQAQLGPRSPAPCYGTSGIVSPQCAQIDQGFASPFSYGVIAGSGLTPAQRAANRVNLNAWWQAIGYSSPGALGTMSGQRIELSCTPGIANEVNFTNPTSGVGGLLMAQPATAALVVYNGNGTTTAQQNAWPPTCDGVNLGGIGQYILGLQVQAGVGATINPAVNTLTLSMSGGVMTTSAQAATNITASVSGTTLSTTVISGAPINTTSVLAGSGVTTGTTVTGGGTCSSLGVCTYALSNNLGTISSEAMTLSPTTGSGAVVPGTLVIPPPGTSTVPTNCFVQSVTTAWNGTTGVYVMGGGCAASTFSSTSGNGGNAGELVEDGVHGGSSAFAFLCPEHGHYMMQRPAGWLRSGVLVQINASAWGFCGTGNGSFSNTYADWNGDTRLQAWDFRDFGAGGSGDVYHNMYFNSGGANNVARCATFGRVPSDFTQFNCEGMVFGAVQTAEQLDPAYGGGAQARLVNYAAIYMEGGNVRVALNDMHFESDSVLCAGNGVDNWVFFWAQSGSILNVDRFENPTFSALNSNGCNHIHLARMYGSNVVVTLKNYLDPSVNASQSGHMTLTGGVTFDIATSTNLSVTQGALTFGRRIVAGATQPALSETVYQLATADVPVIKSIEDGASYFSASGTTTASVSGLKGVITVTGLTTAPGTTSAQMVVTDTNFVNASSYGVSCRVQNYTGTGTPIITNPTWGAGTFSFYVTNIDGSTALNANVPVWCEIDNGKA